MHTLTDGESSPRQGRGHHCPLPARRPRVRVRRGVPSPRLVLRAVAREGQLHNGDQGVPGRREEPRHGLQLGAGRSPPQDGGQGRGRLVGVREVGETVG